MRTISYFLIFCTILLADVNAQSNPESSREDVALRRVATVEANAVRVAYDLSTNALYYNTLEGDIWRINRETGTQEQVYSASDHGITNLQGFIISPEGTMYFVGNERLSDSQTQGVVVRAERMMPGEDDRLFVELARTEPYVRTGFFDHIFNGIALSPDGTSIYLNSGANTDHGEDQSVSKPALSNEREVPVTTKILRLPADGENLLIENDLESLIQNGYLYSDGIRNSFDLAFNREGDLFAVENSGDRDDPEEMNWIREGHHYGFPWRMGMNDTPQQFPGYNPASDIMLDLNSWAGTNGFFYNDPDYPAPPEGVTFTDPVPNFGPDGDAFRDPADGQIKDASDLGIATYSLTPHRSPLGLVFDVEAKMGEPFSGDGFMTSWTPLTSFTVAPFGVESEDILHLELTKNADGSNYEMRSTQIVTGFRQPVDMEIIDNTLYLIENNSGANQPGLWEITMPEVQDISVEDPAVPETTVILESYPNPVTNRVLLTYSISSPQNITVEIFDTLGRRRADVASGWYNEGRYELPVQLDTLEPGVYLIRTMTDHGAHVRKITVVR